MGDQSIDAYGTETSFRQLSAILRERPHQADEPLPPFRELANEYGVSLGVVQRAVKLLRDEGLVMTRRNIGSVWMPGGVVERTPLKIGVISPMGASSMSMMLYNWALNEYFVGRGESGVGIFRSSAGERERECELARQNRRLGVCGMLLSPGEDSDCEFWERQAGELPVVAIDNALPGSWLPSVLHDYRAAGEEMVRELKRRRRRRVLLVEARQSNGSIREMTEALLDGLVTTVVHLPLFEAEESATRGDYSPFHAIGERLSAELERSEYDVFMCPYREMLDRLFCQYLPASHRGHLLPVSIVSNKGCCLSEMLAQAEPLFWQQQSDQLIKVALERLLNWRAGHQRTTGVKRIRLRMLPFRYGVGGADW